MNDDHDAILLCDDDGAVLPLAHAIRMHNLTVDVARSATEAIEKLERRSFGAFVVVDSMLYNGLPLVGYIQRTRPELLSRVIVVSSGATTRRIRPNSAEVFATVTKPVDAHALVGAIHECGRRERSHQRVDSARSRRTTTDDSSVRA